MSQVRFHVLVVEDDESAGQLIAMLIQAHGHRVELVTSGQAALARLEASPTPDVVLLDVMMPEMGGIEALRRYRQQGGVAPVVMVSAMDEAHTIVQAMRVGATDYVTKPINKDELLETLQRVVEMRPMRASTSTSVLSGPTAATTRTLGVSPAMRRVEALIERVADADVPILITGESGVGKDVVARELHARSSRRDRVFVKINCAALPENLLESELFGYERGAFTGAQRTKPGQFELADGGTLFLDEIGEMPAPLQAKLLQALQDGEFYRVGGQKKVKVDVRLIVATNVNLEQAIREGRFREDLYYRLNVVHLRIPPLRERRDDIPQLLAHFIERYGRRYGRSAADVSPEVVQRFLTYDWPGNVRELENLVRRLMVLRDPSYVYAEMSLADGRREAMTGEAPPPAPPTTIPSYQGVPAAPPAPPPAEPMAPPVIAAPPAATGQLAASPAALGPITPALAAPLVAPGLVDDTHDRTLRPAGYPPAPTFADAVPTVAPQVSAALDPTALRAALPGGYPGSPYGTGPITTGALPPSPAPAPPVRGGSYPFGGYASDAAARPLGEVVAAEFSAAGESGRVDLKALGRKAADIVEREAIVAMLARTGGSKREAAERLGISYKAILYKIREFGIGRPRVPRRPSATEAAAAPSATVGELPDLDEAELDEDFDEPQA